MSPGEPPTLILIRRHLVALDAAVKQLRRHAGCPAENLKDLDEALGIERGLQICVENCLDIATHLAVAGRGAPDYATAIRWLGGLPCDFAAVSTHCGAQQRPRT